MDCNGTVNANDYADLSASPYFKGFWYWFNFSGNAPSGCSCAGT
jgi:hypothetical protein